MMGVRLLELHRVLKPNGSLYLHCDPVASHYLKILLDGIFDPPRFRNEIVWKRTFAHGNVTSRFGDVTDSILYYTKGAGHVWNQQYKTLTLEEIQAKYRNRDADGRMWQSVTLRNPGVRPNLHYPYRASNGVTYHPHPNGCPAIRPVWNGMTGRTGCNSRPPQTVRSGSRCMRTKARGSGCNRYGTTSRPLVPRPRNAWATPPRSRSPSLNASSCPAATPATSSSIPSAAAGRQPTPPRSSAAAGSA